MMTRLGMDRKQYEMFWACRFGGRENIAGENLASQVARLDSEYPRRTESALSELRQRGYDANLAILEFLIRSGVVSPEGPNEKSLLWTKDEIDAVADYLEQQELWTTGCIASHYFGVPYWEFVILHALGDDHRLGITRQTRIVPCIRQDGYSARLYVEQADGREMTIDSNGEMTQWPDLPEGDKRREM